MAEKSDVKIDRFDGTDFSFWKMQMEDMLYQKKLYQPLTGVKPEGMDQGEWELLDRQALGVVRLSLAKNVAYNIVGETTTAGVFKALSNMYEKPSALNKVFLIRQLVNARMMESSSAADHVNEFNLILTRLKSVDIKFEDELEALFLLSSLPDSWSGLVTAVSGSSGTTKLTFEGIRDLILSEGIRRKDSSGNSGSVLSVSRGRAKSRSTSRSKNVVCWNCQQVGHYRSKCPKLGGSVSTMEIEDALVCQEGVLDESWVLDSGASFHATPYMNEMANFKLYSGKVRVANGSTLDVAGVGDLVVRHMDSKLILKNVRFIPKLKRRLISVGQLDDDGCHVLFGDQRWMVFKEGHVVARGYKRGTMYMVEEWLGDVVVTKIPSRLMLSGIVERSCLSGSSREVEASGDSGRVGYTRAFVTSSRHSPMATLLRSAEEDEQEIFGRVTVETSVQWELARGGKSGLSKDVRTYVVDVPTVKAKAVMWKIKGVITFSHGCLDGIVHMFVLPAGLFYVGKINRVDVIMYGWIAWAMGLIGSGRTQTTRYLLD